MNNKTFLPFVALCLIWGSTWYFIKITLNAGMPPMYGVGIRFFFSGLLFFLILLFRKESIPINKQSIKLYLSFALLNFSLSYGITYWATQYIYSSISAIIWGLFPAVTSLMAHFMIPNDPNERLTQNKLLALGIGFIGLTIIFSNQTIDFSSNSFIGILLLMCTVVAAAYPSVLYKKHSKEVNHYQMNAVCQLITGVVMLSLSYFIETEDTMQLVWTNELILSTIYLIVLGGVVSWGIYFWLYQHLTVTQVTYVAIFPPIVAIIIGWIFLNEVLTIKEIIGTIFILSGSVLIYRK
ncbi:MAG TPA: DMT family transporter [Nitrososphaerales archaeon]|nr:DMT family transporter [Nitrososphaerales archaeon]